MSVIEPALTAALRLLDVTDSTPAALNLAVYAMSAPGVDVEFWLHVYCWVETVGAIRSATAAELARQKVSPGATPSP